MPETFDPSWEYYTPDSEVDEIFESRPQQFDFTRDSSPTGSRVFGVDIRPRLYARLTLDFAKPSTTREAPRTWLYCPCCGDPHLREGKVSRKLRYCSDQCYEAHHQHIAKERVELREEARRQREAQRLIDRDQAFLLRAYAMQARREARRKALELRRLERLRRCKQCDRLYNPQKPKSKYCSHACFDEFRRQKSSYPICKQCSQTFEVRTKRVRKYCSIRCASVVRGLDVARRRLGFTIRERFSELAEEFKRVYMDPDSNVNAWIQSKGLSRCVVQRWRIKLNLPRRRSGRPSTLFNNPQLQTKCRELYASGVRMADISRQLQVAERNLRRWLRSQGYAKRI